MEQVRVQRESGWFGIDNEVIDQTIKIIGPTAFSVYCALCRYANTSNQCWPSMQTIADKLGISKRSVSSAIATLCEQSLISRECKEDGSVNLYTIHPVQKLHTPVQKLHHPVQNLHGGIAKNAQGVGQNLPSNNTNTNKTKELPVLNTKTSPHKEVITHFVDTYQKHRGHKYHFLPKDAVHMRNLLLSADKDEVIRRIDRMFQSQDKFIQGSGYTVGVLISCFNKLTADVTVKATGASGREL